MKKIYFIAEAGVNHNGDMGLAMNLIDVAAEAGADAVKFQTFKSDELVAPSAAKAEYQEDKSNPNQTQLEMLKKLEISEDFQKELVEHCSKAGIEFMSTAFDSKSLDFLINDLGMKVNKIPSGEITNAPLLIHHGRTKNKIILSTGMSTIDEIEDALSAICFGILQKNGKPSAKGLHDLYKSAEVKDELKKRVILLHCTSEYPALDESINLKAMRSIRDFFDLSVGYSDHSLGIEVSLMAATMGASVIEKHFTMDKNLDGPDHKASLNPNELKNLVDLIRRAERIIGNGEKAPTLVEEKNKIVSRRSIFANSEIKKGDQFSLENLTLKRPGDGISPFRMWDLINKHSKKDYKKDEKISQNEI